MTGKMQTIGSRAQVWHGTAKKTSGGLTKQDLMMNKAHRIVSKTKHFTAKREQRLLKHGYGTKKGTFGFVKLNTRKHRKGSKKMRGGMMPLSPHDLNSSYSLTGGRRRRMMRGGSGLAALSPQGSANWSGDGIAGQGITMGDAGSANIQLLAGMAGGKRRRRGMRGGTGNRGGPLGSDAVQMRAGLGN